MRPRNAFLILCGSILLPLAVVAEDAQPPGLERIEDVPPPPPPMESGEVVEPTVTVVQRKDARIEEYRLNGRLYMIRVEPVIGKPYYLMDKTGKGLMESKISELYNDPIVPQWVIFSW